MADNNPTSLNCPACGAPLDTDGTRAVVRCNFCGNVSLLPGVLPTQAAAPASALEEIRKLAGGGNLVDAIERYRQTYGADLPEAKNAIEALRAGRLATPSAEGMRPAEELTKALQEVQRLLADGNKIGAIKVYRENYDVSLTRAKYAIDQIEGGNTLQPESGFESPVSSYQQAQVSPPQVAPARKGRRWLGCGVTVAVLALVAGIIAFALLRTGASSPFVPHYNPNGPVTLIPSDQAAAPNFALGLYDPGKDTRFIGLLDGTTAKLSWHAAPLSGDGYLDAVAAGPDMVYAANGSILLAYHKSDGSLAWQAQMPDKLNYGDSTLLVTAGVVLTTNADQTIQAYNAATGAQVWNKRLSGYDRTLRLFGNSLLVVDYIDNDYHYGLLFIDPATGGQQNMISPTCTFNDYDSTIDPDAGFVYDQAGNALFLVYDSSYGCVQRLDLTSGQIAWSSGSKDSYSFSSNGFQSLDTTATLYFSDGKAILAVDKSTGDIQPVLTNPDYDLLPLATAGDKLIVRARRTRGTEKFELWGVNAASGGPAWQMDMQGASPIDPPNEMSGLVDDTDFGWTWKLVPAGVVVITFRGQPNQLTLETFNPADGASLGKQTLPLKNITGDFYSIPTVIGWQGGRVYLDIEANIYSLDVATATLKIVY